MNNEDLQAIRKTQNTLLQISLGHKVFFNITNYEKLGLTTSRKVWGTASNGNKEVIRHTHHLTEKGERVLNTLV